MKQQYIKQVEKKLNLSRKMKKEVLRDLDEVFISALEHGEAEQQVIDRLGEPEEFARSIHEQLGVCCTGKRQRRKKISIIITALISVIAFVTTFFIHVSRPAKNIIGQADATTTIQIIGIGIDMFWLIILFGCITLIIAICLIAHYIHKKN